MSKPLVYRYFDSKQGLYAACIERSTTRIIDALLEHVRAGVRARADAAHADEGVQAIARAARRRRSARAALARAPPDESAERQTERLIGLVWTGLRRGRAYG